MSWNTREVFYKGSDWLCNLQLIGQVNEFCRFSNVKIINDFDEQFLFSGGNKDLIGVEMRE